MPVVIDELRMIMGFVEKIGLSKEDVKLGDLLASVSKKVKEANPTEDIRRLREDEVYDLAKKRYPDKEVMLAKVPTEDTLIL